MDDQSPIRSVRDFFLQLVTITAGVLIALLLEGLVGWNNNRVLVNEARATIRREIADNKAALDAHLEGVEERSKDLQNTLNWATERLKTGKSDLKVSVGFSASPLSTAAWETAARTGALTYSDVQKYPNLYCPGSLRRKWRCFTSKCSICEETSAWNLRWERACPPRTGIC